MHTHELLYQLRALAKLEPSELAYLLGCHRSLISRYETNQREPSFILVKRWIQVTKPDISHRDYENWLAMVTLLIFDDANSDYELLVEQDAVRDATQTKAGARHKAGNLVSQILPRHFLKGIAQYLKKEGKTDANK